MRWRQKFGNLVKLALAGACLYAAVKWQAMTSGNGEVAAFAREACIDEIGVRFGGSNVTVYKVTKNSSGFVVRASFAPTRGATASVVCLTNPHGGVREIMFEER